MSATGPGVWRSRASMPPGARVPRLDAGHVANRRLHVGEPVAAQERVSTRADAQVRDIPPIGDVVEALHAGPRPVGDLVVVQARPGERLVCPLVHVRGQVRVLLGEQPVGLLLVEGRSFLQRQRVRRDVLGSCADDALDVPLPCLHALVGQTVHQVRAEVVKSSLLNRRQRCERLRRTVPPTQHAQLGVVQRLHAQADAVYACLPEGRKALDGGVVGVHLCRDLRARCDGEGVDDRRQEACHLGWREHGRCAAAQEHRVHRGVFEGFSPNANLALQRREVGWQQVVDAGVGVEVAVGALGLAEGDVDVQGDAAGQAQSGLTDVRLR